MFLLSFPQVVAQSEPGRLVQVAGPEMVSSDAKPPGRSDAMDFFVARGPAKLRIFPRAPSWAWLLTLQGTIRSGLPGCPPGALNPKEFGLLAPGARASLVLEEGAALVVGVVPPQPSAVTLGGEAAETEACAGVSWVVRPSEVEPALAARDTAKIAVGNLWRAPAPPGPWHGGTEILCEQLAVGAFRTGSPETAHQHQRAWEIYQVLEGELLVRVRTYRLGPWESVAVHASEALLLPPGTAHVVQENSRHLSLVLQAPPALTDREIVSFTQSTSPWGDTGGGPDCS